jgi:DNA-directed RNA polymerase subunit RPC12/RpoP
MSDDTVEIDRLALADAVASLRIARKQINNSQTRLVQGITEIEALLADEEPDEDPVFTIRCISCSHEFDPIRTQHIIIGPWSARYTCPECGTTVRGPPPNPERSDNTDEE